MLNQEVINSTKESVLCWLATVDKEGRPNVSPKEMYLATDENTILIANIASPNSVRNIKSNSAVCLSFINIFKQKGFKVNGQATIIEREDSEFVKREQELRVLGGEKFTIQSVIKIKVTEVSSIVAPSYRLFDDTIETDMVRQSMDTYGVQPKVV